MKNVAFYNHIFLLSSFTFIIVLLVLLASDDVSLQYFQYNFTISLVSSVTVLVLG